MAFCALSASSTSSKSVGCSANAAGEYPATSSLVMPLRSVVSTLVA